MYKSIYVFNPALDSSGFQIKIVWIKVRMRDGSREGGEGSSGIGSRDELLEQGVHNVCI